MIHVDGSTVFVPQSQSEGIGWAVVACHEDKLEERYGGVPHLRRGPLTGCHEQIAFIEGVLYAHAAGFAPQDVTILCDDDLFGYAQQWLHPENYLTTRADQVRERLDRVAVQLYQVGTVELVLDYFEAATIHKLKGHSLDVYQERADYLAKCAAKAACALDMKEPRAYEDWLATGIASYDYVNEVALTWHAPFVVAATKKIKPSKPS